MDLVKAGSKRFNWLSRSENMNRLLPSKDKWPLTQPVQQVCLDDCMRFAIPMLSAKGVLLDLEKRDNYMKFLKPQLTPIP